MDKKRETIDYLNKYICTDDGFSMQEAIDLNVAIQACLKIGNFLYKGAKLFDPSINHILDIPSDWAEEYYSILGYFEETLLNKINANDDVNQEKLANYLDDLIKDGNKEFYLDDVLKILIF